MRCRKVSNQLSAFLDGELPPEETERIQKHLDSCPKCSKEREALERTIRSVQGLPLVTAPADLRERILADLEAEPKPGEARHAGAEPRFRLRMLWPAAAAVLITVIIAVFSPAVRDKYRSRRPQRLAEKAETPKSPARPEGGRQFAKLDKKAPLESMITEADRMKRAPTIGAHEIPDRAAGRESKTGPGFTPDEMKERGSLEKLEKSIAELQEVRTDAKSVYGRGAAPPSKQFVILTSNPQGALARAATITREYGWLSEKELQRARDEKLWTPSSVASMELLLTADEIVRLQHGLARAGLMKAGPSRKGKAEDVRAEDAARVEAQQRVTPAEWKAKVVYLDVTASPEPALAGKDMVARESEALAARIKETVGEEQKLLSDMSRRRAQKQEESALAELKPTPVSEAGGRKKLAFEEGAVAARKPTVQALDQAAGRPGGDVSATVAHVEAEKPLERVTLLFLEVPKAIQADMASEPARIEPAAGKPAEK